jgi:hypothetical protein
LLHNAARRAARHHAVGADHSVYPSRTGEHKGSPVRGHSERQPVRRDAPVLRLSRPNPRATRISALPWSHQGRQDVAQGDAQRSLGQRQLPEEKPRRGRQKRNLHNAVLSSLREVRPGGPRGNLVFGHAVQTEIAALTLAMTTNFIWPGDSFAGKKLPAADGMPESVFLDSYLPRVGQSRGKATCLLSRG